LRDNDRLDIGIGGGSMNIATYVSILSFTPRQSVPLSKVVLLRKAVLKTSATGDDTGRSYR